MTLLTHRRNVATNAAEGISTCGTAEAARDFLLHLHHANISLSLTVVKRNAQMMQESQHLMLIGVQTVPQTASGMTFAPSSLACFGRGIWRQGLFGLGQQGFIALYQAVSERGIHMRFTSLPCLIRGSFHVQQDGFKLACPVLGERFFYPRQFTQMMHVAQCMGAWIALIAVPAIMNADPFEQGRNADGIHSFTASFRMPSVVRQARSCADMHPVPLAANIESCFVLMEHTNLLQSGFDGVFHRDEVLSTSHDPAMQRTNRNADTHHLSKHLADPFIGQQMGLRQGDRHRLNGWAILHRSCDLLRKRCLSDGLATRTAFALGLMLGHHETWDWNVKDLTAGATPHGLNPEIVLTGATDVRSMNNDLIRSCHLDQMMPGMTLLSSRRLVAFLAQTLGLASEPIGGRRQVTVVTVFLETAFQFLHTVHQELHLVLQGGNAFIFLLIFCPKSLNLLIFVHTATLPVFLFICKGLALLSSYQYTSYVEHFSAQAVLNNVPISLEALRIWRSELRHQGHAIDPLSEWRDLVGYVGGQKR